MKKVIRKWYTHYEKEEKWLNEMSARGLAFIKYSWCKYVFEDCTPGEYIYRIELLENGVSHPKSQEYITFLGDMGVEHISSYSRWVYFRKKAVEGSFDLYSDKELRIAHYRRIVKLWGIIGLINILVGFSNLHTVGTLPESTNLMQYFSLVNWGLGALLVGFCLPYLRKIKRLQKEKLLEE